MGRVADRLRTARLRGFVGRADEIALFESTLASRPTPFQVLFVFGPGGIGKTSLLHNFAERCETAGGRAYYLDARNLEPSPHSVLGAIGDALGVEPDHDPIEELGAQPYPTLLLFDNYEAVASLDGWFRDDLLPRVPKNVLFVPAQRDGPSAAWRADPGWQALLKPLPLRNFTPTESRAFLEQRAVPAEQQEVVLSFTHGHPLALSLVADLLDQRPGFRFEPEAAPDLIRTLLGQLVQSVPGPAHRAALEACALVRLTTENLLAQMLGTPDAHELFDWLRTLSLIESGPSGICPHDLAREAIVTDVRWRNPDWYAELHQRARSFYAGRLAQAHHRQPQQDVLIDYIFLHRDNRVVRPFFDLLSGGRKVGEGARTDWVRPEDQGSLLEMVERHEGPESALIARHWLERQPGNVLVFRASEPDAPPAGFLTMVPLPKADDQGLALDPAARAASDYLARHAPLRSGESATLFRFWMAGDTYQAVSPVQGLIFVHMVRHYLTTPGLAFTFLPCADPNFWAPLFAYADLVRLPEADFEVGGSSYGVYGHDWRLRPPTAWLDLLAERELGAPPESRPLPSAQEVVVLNEQDFRSAVRDGLRDYLRVDVLQSNPLARSRLVLDRIGAGAAPAERASALQRLVGEAAESLQATPREARLYRVLFHTYLRPALTQLEAAAQLDLPFSTYRRYLAAGTTRVADILWSLEVG